MHDTIELINPDIPRGKIRCAVFDFDGTLSLLRAGWPQAMRAVMLDALRATPLRAPAADLERFVTDFIYQSSGQQTIYQMIRLAEEVEKRGGAPKPPETYKQIFADRVLARVNERVAAIRAGKSTLEEWRVPGALALLQSLRARGVTCYIASGTDEPFVQREAALLQLAPYCAEIFGAHADYANHSKKVVIRNLVARHALRAGELVTFGDGAPEIVDTKAVGGIAVGVASNEETRDGIEPRKRAVLLRAGADLIVPDYRAHAELLAWLCGEN
ncbi:MAG: HAD family hydrolase [Chloroflexi bacterium]|nr:HAD family hydrolase [Chloroflexota bacterium]